MAAPSTSPHMLAHEPTSADHTGAFQTRLFFLTNARRSRDDNREVGAISDAAMRSLAAIKLPNCSHAANAW